MATPYIGNEDPIELTVDEQHLPIMNPKRAKNVETNDMDERDLVTTNSYCD